MIPTPFDYARATSVPHAIELLGEGGEDAALLAGGHSLLPMMKLRLAAPALLVDIGGLEELRYIRREGETVVIGAATPYHDLVTADVVRQGVPLLGRVAATVGDAQIRYRGTIGGSLAHADPAGDLPAAVCALDGVMVAHGPDGVRHIPADEFFVDYFSTALTDDEVLTEVRVPVTGAEQYWYEKFTARSAGWAIVAVAVAGTRIALAGMAPTPVRATAAEEALAVGADAAAAAELATADVAPISDAQAAGDYRRHLARVLTHRALLAAEHRR